VGSGGTEIRFCSLIVVAILPRDGDGAVDAMAGGAWCDA
jgi:hypothetical protein